MLYEFYSSKVNEKKAKNIMDELFPSTPQITDFDDNFRIDDLADAMDMSRPVFYRKVKSLLGMSPSDFVRSIRIKRAVQLLEQDCYTVSEVGYMSGFATPQYFCRVFKEAMDCTPKEYTLKVKPSSEQNR